MRLTVRQLLVFKTIVEEGGFRRGAEALHTSQPALSNTIKALEDALGIPVFYRTTRSVRLTEAGRELFNRTGQIFDLLEETSLATQDVAAGRGGAITISYVDFAILGPLPEILESYRAINPRIQIKIGFGATLKQIEQVKNGHVDVGFIMDIDTRLPQGIERRQISLESLVVILPPSHRLARRDSIELAELADESFIAGDSWLRYTNLINDLCVERGFVPKVTQKAYLRDEMLAFVLAGLGVLVYPTCIMNAGRFGLSAVPISDVPKLIKTSAIWKAKATNPVLPSFLSLIPEDS